MNKYQQIINNLIIQILKETNIKYYPNKQKGFKKMLSLTKKNWYKNTAVLKLFRKNQKKNKNSNKDKNNNINSFKNFNFFDENNEDENIYRANSVGNLNHKLNLEDELQDWNNETEEDTRDNTGNADGFMNDFEEINIKNHERITAEMYVNNDVIIENIFGKISKSYKNINKQIKENIKNNFILEKYKNINNDIVLKEKKKSFFGN